MKMTVPTNRGNRMNSTSNSRNSMIQSSPLPKRAMAPNSRTHGIATATYTIKQVQIVIFRFPLRVSLNMLRTVSEQG